MGQQDHDRDPPRQPRRLHREEVRILGGNPRLLRCDRASELVRGSLSCSHRYLSPPHTSQRSVTIAHDEDEDFIHSVTISSEQKQQIGIVKKYLHYFIILLDILHGTILDAINKVYTKYKKKKKKKKNVLSEDGLHLGVGLEVLLVLGVLELVCLEVGPDSLDHLGPGQLLTLLGSNEVSELGAQGQRLGQSGSLRHFVGFSR